MGTSQTAYDIFLLAKGPLANLYDDTEAATIAYWLVEDYCRISKVDVAMRKMVELRNEEALLSAIRRLSTGEPIQYVLGYTEFFGLKFEVSSQVLIPRPETEDLIAAVIAENLEVASCLDIGTGSGCIAISLANHFPNARITAWEKEPEALEIAKKNAQLLGVEVEFQQTDIFEDWPEFKVEIIVSNPPYVLHSEKMEMRENVTLFEPGTALYVPDDNPLMYYYEIAKKGKKILEENGKMYFEINERFGKEVQNLLSDLGYENISVHQDIYQKERVVVATFKGSE